MPDVRAFDLKSALRQEVEKHLWGEMEGKDVLGDAVIQVECLQFFFLRGLRWKSMSLCSFLLVLSCCPCISLRCWVLKPPFQLEDLQLGLPSSSLTSWRMKGLSLALVCLQGQWAEALRSPPPDPFDISWRGPLQIFQWT